MTATTMPIQANLDPRRTTTAGRWWRDAAACTGLPPEWWFPGAAVTGKGSRTGRTTLIALQVCRSCPVRTECLLEKRVSGSTVGIWGGQWPRLRKG